MATFLGGINGTKFTYKHPSAKKVLRLMDKDFGYSEAVNIVVKEDKISKKRLEKLLEPFI